MFCEKERHPVFRQKAAEGIRNVCAKVRSAVKAFSPPPLSNWNRRLDKPIIAETLSDKPDN